MKGPLRCAIYYCLMIFVASQGIFTCDPATDCETATPGSLVPDPNDCERYFVCISVGGQTVPSTNSIKCNDGQYFDQLLPGCSDEPTPGTCGPNICPINLCTSECPNPYINIEYVADKYSCNSYYICLQTGSLKVTCPTNTPYFDGFSCVTDESKCCDFCTAYCKAPGTQIVDPCDCSSYYICLVSGTASENFKFTCASGTFYDEATATCQSGSCINICSNCGTGNTIASSQTTVQPPIETTPTIVTTTTTTTASAISTPTTTTASAISTTTTTTASAISTTTTTTASAISTTTTTTASAISTTTTTTASAISTTTMTTASAISTPTTPIGGCTSLESFTCPSNGNFQMCPYCFKYFFHCSGGTATISECSGNNVYNPNDQFPYCFDPTNCPYP